MRAIAVSVLVFLVGGIAGPVLRWVTWPPGGVGDGTGFSIRDFFYDLVLLLWPTQPLGVIEVSTGRSLAIVFAVVANLILFAIAGFIAGIAAKRLPVFIAMYVLVCIMLTVLTYWNAGIDLGQTGLIALFVAFAAYATLFFITFRLRRFAR
jgi:hypothetical protein